MRTAAAAGVAAGAGAAGVAGVKWSRKEQGGS